MQETGSEAVTASFQRMGAASEQMSSQMQRNNRAIIMSTAAMSTQTLGLINLFERLSKGQTSAGEAALQLSYYTLNLASQLMMLNMLYGKRIGLQGASIVATSGEAVANSAATASSWTHTLALRAQSVALAVKNALLGPGGWAILAGAGVAMLAGMALISQIPKAANGGIFTQPTIAMIGEAGPEAVVPLNRGFGNAITVNVYGARDYWDAKRGAFDGAMEAYRQIDSLQRKGAA